jgi:hypothetical protein
MGHSRGGDVNSIYTHVELPTLKDAIGRLDAWHTDKVRVLRTGSNHQPTHNEPSTERKDETDDRTQIATPVA